MRRLTGLIITLMMALSISACMAGATAKNIALSQAHELYFNRYEKASPGVIQDSGLLFIKVKVDYTRGASRKYTEHKALVKIRDVLTEYLRQERGIQLNDISYTKLPSRALVNRRDEGMLLYVVVTKDNF